MCTGAQSSNKMVLYPLVIELQAFMSHQTSVLGINSGLYSWAENIQNYWAISTSQKCHIIIII